MGKYQNKKRKKRNNSGMIAAIIILFVITLVGFVLFVMPQLLYDENAASETTETAATETSVSPTGQPAQTAAAAETEAPVVDILPLTLENGDLEVTTLFLFDGINPDCGNQQGTDIASIQLKNTSGIYLAEAKIVLTLDDGTLLNFAVTDLPAGKSVVAFSLENQSLAANAVCVDAVCEAEFDESAVTESEQVSVFVEGMTVTLTNISGEDISEIVICCRCPIDEDYFGGITYTYTINDLAAGESTTVEARDCILGMAEVVRIAIGQE